MQILRITRKSNDGTSVVAFVLSAISAAVLVIVAIVAWSADDVMPALVAGSLSMILSGGSGYLLKGLCLPHQLEFVIESDCFRFGREDRPGLQKVIRRSEVKCLILDDGPDSSLCISTGKAISPHLAPGILIFPSQMVPVVDAVREHWPEVPVYDREMFQSVCRAKRKPTH